MSYTVFVDGQEGTTGLQIHDLLARRRDIEVLRIATDLRKDNAEQKAPAQRRRRVVPVLARSGCP